MTISTPTTIDTTTVFGYVYDSDGTTAIKNASITFTSDPFQIDDNLIQIDETVTSNAAGLYQATLPQTESVNVTVKVEIKWTDSDEEEHLKTETISIGTTDPISVQAARATTSTETLIITNATHTGEVTGSGPLTVDKTAISNKSLVTAAVGDHILVGDASDSDALKKVTVQTIVDLASDGSPSTITSTTTLDDTYSYVLCDSTSGIFTVTLPTAVGNSGLVYDIQKTDSSINIITIDGDGTETINGVTTYKLFYQYNSVRIVSNGTNWIVLESKVDTDWVLEGTIPFEAVTTDPTKGTVVRDKMYKKRRGDCLLIKIDYEQSAAGFGGSGIYIFPYPDSLTMDTVKQDISTSNEIDVVLNSSGTVSFNADGISTVSRTCVAYPFSSTHFGVRIQQHDQGYYLSHTYLALDTVAMTISVTLEVPITDWKTY